MPVSGSVPVMSRDYNTKEAPILVGYYTSGSLFIPATSGSVSNFIKA
jgi:hypothetical protein